MTWGWDDNKDSVVDSSDTWHHLQTNERWQEVAVWKAGDTDVMEVFTYGQAGMDGYGGSSYIDSIICRERDITTNGSFDDRYYYLQNWRHDVVAIMTYDGAIKERVMYDAYVFNEETQHYIVRFRHYSPYLGRWLERDPAGYVDGENLYQYVRSSPAMLADAIGLDAGWARRPAGGDPWGSSVGSCELTATQQTKCMDKCVAGCPKTWTYTTYYDAVEMVHVSVPTGKNVDPACVNRCKIICALGNKKNTPCPPKGVFKWKSFDVDNEGSTLIEYSIEGEDVNCCSKFASFQMVRMWTPYWWGNGGSWGEWDIDDGRVGGESHRSPEPPFMHPSRDFRERGRGNGTHFDRPHSLGTTVWDLKVYVICVEGPAAGHVYGSYSWQVTTYHDENDSKPFGHPDTVPDFAPMREYSR